MVDFVAVVVVDSGCCLMCSCDVDYCDDYSCWCCCCCCRSSRSLVLMVRCSFALIVAVAVAVVEGVEIYIHGSIVDSLFLDFVLIVRILLLE